MGEGKLRILLVGDASNCHNALARGLRKLGHEVVVASDGTDWMDTPRDIDLHRRWNNKFGGAELLLRMRRLLPRMTGFDVVSIATQGFIRLRPERQKIIYDFLRKNNRSMFYTALATDSNYVRYALSPDCQLRYTEYTYSDNPTPYFEREKHLTDSWLSDKMISFCDHIYDTVDGAVSVLYEYDMALRARLDSSKIVYGGIPVDTASLEHIGLPDRIKKMRLFLGRHRDRVLEKGGELLEAAAKSVVERYPDRAELVIVENLPYHEYLILLKSAHLVLDQLYSYTPATNALLAMAYGLCVMSGGEPEYYEFIGEKELHPIVNGVPEYETLVKTLERLVLHPDEIRLRGKMGRPFVEKHNSAVVVAARFADFWQKKLDKVQS